MIQPYRHEALGCINAIQGLKKLRLLEVVLPCDLTPGFPHPRDAWESQVEGHAIAVLGNIRGHTKVLKMISIGSSYSHVEIRDVKIHTVTVP